MAKVLAKNRKALFDYSLIEKVSAGIVLKGHEVKAIKEGKVNFEGSYVQVLDDEPYVVNMHIGRYSKQSSDFNKYEATRSRKLLLKKKEIEDLQKAVSQKRHTAIPLALVLDRNKIKLEFGIVKGRKEYEKKEVTKRKQQERDLDRETKNILIK